MCDQSAESQARIGVQRERGAVPRRNPDHIVLAHFGHNLHAAEIRNPQQFRAGHLGGAHHPFAQRDAEPGNGALHGGADDGFREIFPCLLEGGLSAADIPPGGGQLPGHHVGFRLGSLQFRGGDGVLRVERPGADQRGGGLTGGRLLPGKFRAERSERGFRLFNQGEVEILLDFHEDIPLVDRISLPEVQLHDFAGDIRRDGDFRYGAQLAAGGYGLHQVARGYPHDLHFGQGRPLASAQQQEQQQEAARHQGAPEPAFGARGHCVPPSPTGISRKLMIFIWKRYR